MNPQKGRSTRKDASAILGGRSGVDTRLEGAKKARSGRVFHRLRRSAIEHRQWGRNARG